MNDMELQLRGYVEELFQRAPKSPGATELREEVLQNLLEKYHDLLSQGKLPEAAYNITIASIGDMDRLIANLWNQEGLYDRPTRQEVEQARTKSAALTAGGVMCIILSVVPILMGFHIVSMFFMVAVGVGLLIYNGMSKPLWLDENNMVDDFHAWKNRDAEHHQLKKAISAVIWAVTLAVYFYLSFRTGDWHITWVIFPLAGAASAFMEALLDLKHA